MNENQTVNTKAVENEDQAKQETPAPENTVIDTKRKIKFQSPVTIVHVPKKQKKAKEPAADEENPEPKPSKLQKVKRTVAAVGLISGAALVGLGSYLKGKNDGAEALANDIRDTLGDESKDNEPAPDPAGVSETSESSDD